MSNKKTLAKIGLIGCLMGCLLVGVVGFVAVRWLGNAALSPQNAPSATSSNPITAMRQAIEQKANDTMQQASSQVAAKAIEQLTGEKIDPQQIAAIQKALQSNETDPAALASQLLGTISGTNMLSGTLGLTGTLKPEDSAALLGQLAKLISGTQGISATSGMLDLGIITDLLGAGGLDDIGSMLGEDGPRPAAKATVVSPKSGGIASNTPITNSVLPVGLEQGNMTLRLPSGKMMRLKAVCAPPKVGAWYEMRASTGVPINHPNYAMVSFSGNVTTLAEPVPMVMTIVLGANGSAFSGLNPDIKLALFQTGAASFTNLSLINTAPNSPDFKFNQPQRFGGEWQCSD